MKIFSQKKKFKPEMNGKKRKENIKILFSNKLSLENISLSHFGPKEYFLSFIHENRGKKRNGLFLCAVFILCWVKQRNTKKKEKYKKKW